MIETKDIPVLASGDRKTDATLAIELVKELKSIVPYVQCSQILFVFAPRICSATPTHNHSQTTNGLTEEITSYVMMLLQRYGE